MADALILRRYRPPTQPDECDAWTVPDDRKVNPWNINGTSTRASAVALVLAGLYQFSPLSLRCLRECRNPAGFVARSWHGVSPRRELLRIGAAYGWSCVGLLLGTHAAHVRRRVSSLGLMALLTATMVAERRLPRIESAVGALLVATGR
ncbi:MAG: DUF2182 domain-containing protein [Egibacteraceae bacterium]